MADKLIARRRECDELTRCMGSDKSEFVIICGRRRIGKTYLVDRFFNGKFDFKYVGGHNMKTREQLRNFAKALKKYSKKKLPELSDWYEAFDALEEYLESLPSDRKKLYLLMKCRGWTLIVLILSARLRIFGMVGRAANTILCL